MTRLSRRRERIMREVQKGIVEAGAVESKDGVVAPVVAEARATRRALERAHTALGAIKDATPEATSLDKSRRIAGPAAIEHIAKTLKQVGHTTQSEVTRATGLNSGTVTHALRVLEADGLARRTGQRFRGSDEWAWVAVTARERRAA